MAAWTTIMMTSLNLPLICCASPETVNNSRYDLADIWACFIWNRFPSEMYPLFLSPLIKAGRIQEAQERSRVYKLTQEDDVESYSGYLTVNQHYGSNMFFWFLPAQTKSLEAPVLLWLNGGPGRSSMVGALAENGPFQVTKKGGVRLQKVSWTQNFSMLYVDNPVDVGYSFTFQEEGISRTMQEVTENLYRVLVQFFQMFPQYSKSDLFVGGQSYAGKYVPLLGCYIHDRNHGKRPPEVYLNFKGIYVGAGFTDPENMLPVFPDFLFNAGLISDNYRRQLRQKFQQVITAALSGKELNDTDYSMIFIGDPMESTGIDTLNHLLGAKETNTELLWQVDSFMGTPAARLSLHVGYAKRARRLSFSYSTAASLNTEIPISASREHAFLMDNYKVLVYSGNLDIVVNVPMVEAFLNHVVWSGQAQYRQSNRQIWLVKGQLAGWFVTIGNFTRVIVRNAGHMVPYDQPTWALDMMNRFIFNKPFGEDAD